MGEEESAEVLSEKLTSYTWTACSGFRLGGYLFLNDCTSADGCQEYGVIRESGLRQVESLTANWMPYERMLAAVLAISAGEVDGQSWDARISREQIEAPGEHTCIRCA